MIFVMGISVYTPEDTKILHTAYADFVSRQIGRPVHIVQYDDSLPVLAIKLFSDGQSYTIPENANVNIRFNKPDGTYIYNPALGCSEDRHTVYFEVTPQMAACAGESSPVVEVDDKGSAAASSPIGITIDRNPIPNDEIESTNEYKSIVKYAREAVDAAAIASASRSAAEVSENNAKKSEDSANNSKNSASESKNASAISENNAETAAVRAEAAAKAALTAADEAVSIKYSYAVCSSTMGAQIKSVSINGFALAAGAKVTVKFPNGNSANSPTLNVSGTGAKEIYYNGAPVSKNFIKRESVHEFVYDGTHWLLEGEKGAGYYHVTCSTGANVSAKTVVLAGFRLVNGVQMIIQFTNGNTAENPTLNVQNTGAYPIYYGGLPVPVGYITENSAVQLVFDGQNRWVVVGDFLQQQMDALKRFVHYEEIYWEEVPITQTEGHLWSHNDISSGGWMLTQIIPTNEISHPKCAYFDYTYYAGSSYYEKYKIITYDINGNAITAEKWEPVDAYTDILIYETVYPIMAGEQNSEALLDMLYDEYHPCDQITIGDGLIFENSRLDGAFNYNDRLYINSFGSPLDIKVYKQIHYKVW